MTYLSEAAHITSSVGDPFAQLADAVISEHTKAERGYGTLDQDYLMKQNVRIKTMLRGTN